jgi:hypothetical protein
MRVVPIGATKEGPAPGVSWTDKIGAEMKATRNLIAAAQYVLTGLKGQITLYAEGDIVEGLLDLMEEHTINAQCAIANLSGYEDAPNET